MPCRCDCGTEQDCLVQNLRRKDRANPSCGCWKREQAAQQARRQWTKHGKAGTPEKDELYRLWQRIKNRCYNPNADNYRWYGGRGIGIWEGWRYDAAAFIRYVEQELGPRPSPKHSIDRIDNDGDYEPGKIRWATQPEQVRNARPWLQRHASP